MVDSEKNRIRRRAEKADKAICEVAANGERAFHMSIPPHHNDTDVLITTVCREDVPALLSALETAENYGSFVFDMAARFREILVASQEAMEPLAAMQDASGQWTQCYFCESVGCEGRPMKHKEDCAWVLSVKAMSDPNLAIQPGVSDGGGWDDFVHGVGPVELAKEA